MRKAYLDTCIISGVAKGDLAEQEQSAVSTLLRSVDSSDLTICSSTDAKTELLGVPEEHRNPHLAVYNDVATLKASTEWLHPTGAFTGQAEATYRKLIGIVPDDMDARHLTHASMHGVEDFITTDSRTILRYRAEIRDAVGIDVWSPSEYASNMSTGFP